ncbi:unnamed protein product, partial [Lymnaea stagnalis]
MNGNTEEDIGASCEHVFDQFVTAVTCKTILSSFHQLLDLTGLRHANHSNFYEQLKVKLKGSWKAQSLWAKIDKRASHRDYKKQKACSDMRVLVIGSGPCGLRTAIECALLGAKTVLVEKRDRFSRNNVLHLWPYLITDLRNLGAKKFFGKFCAGAIDHISIRQLQCILLKVALLLGVEVHVNVTFEGLIEPPEDQTTRKGWHCKVTPEDHVLSEYEINVLFGADGKRNTLPGFKRKEFRGKLAIAVTANFINRNTQAEARVEEISGVAFIFNQKFFLDLKERTRIDLENIVYYKDDTHYFVMTAKKASLLEKGVLKEDYSDTIALLDRSNVNQEALMAYAKEAADFSTNYQLPNLDYAVNHYGQADVAMFDFTSMFAAENASRFLYKNGHHLLLGLVGDSLLEPFWPTGSGCARGFLGAFDAAWMMRSWAMGRTPLQVLAERESIFTVLSQTTPNYLHKNHNAYSLDPNTRYPNLNLKAIKPSQVKHLYEGGVIEEKETEEEDLTTAVPSKKPRNGDKIIVVVITIGSMMFTAEPTIDSYTLLRWCQRVLNTGKYRDVHIVDFTSSWRSGLALCALIHSFRPEIISNTLLMECEVAANNQMAFNVAEKELGIPPVLTGEDMAKYEVPDKLTMVAYLSQFYELFKNEPLPSSIPLPVKSKRKSLSRDAKIPKSPRSPNRRTSFFQKLSARIAKSKKRKEQEENEGVPLGSKKLKERQEKLDVELTRYNKLPMEEIANRLQLDRKIEDPRIKINKVEERSGAVSVTAMADLLVAKFKNIEGKPPPETVRRMKGQPTLLAASAASEFCSFCHKRVYIMERMSAEGEFFHRGCLKCDHCGVGLRLTNYSCDRDTKPVKFYCYRHALPELRTRPQRKRGLDDESMETIPDMVITPPEEEDTGQASKEKSPRKNAPSQLTPLLISKDRTEQAKNTPERVEFEISFDGCEEESEEEQFEHNLRASMSSDTLLDDEEYSDSDSDMSDCDIESDSDNEVWENALEPHLTLEEANELRGTWRRQHSQENLLEAVEKGHEYIRLGDVNGEEEGSSTEVEDGSEYETDYSSEEEEDSTEEKTESSAKDIPSLKSPLSPVSKISASKASFFSEPPKVVSLDPWSMFGMGKKGAEDEDKKEAAGEVDNKTHRNKSSPKKRVSTSSESKSERKKSTESKRCASSKSTDVSESLELDYQSEDKKERISAAGSLDDLKDLNAEGEGEVNQKDNAVIANCRPLSVDSAQSLQQGSKDRLHSILKRASVDNMDVSESAAAREMEKGSEGDDEHFEDDDDELLEKTAVSLAMEQLLRDMDKSSSKDTGYNNTSDSGENEVFVEGRLSPSAKKAKKFRIKRHAKRSKEKHMSRSSDSEAGRTDPTTTDNSLPRSPVSRSPSTEVEERDERVTEKGSLGSLTDPGTRLPSDNSNISELLLSEEAQPTLTTEVDDESLRKVFENIAAMPDLSDNSDIDDLVIRNVDDRFVTDRRKRTKRKSKPSDKKRPALNIDKETDTFSNTSFSISTPSESESTVSSIEVDEFAGQILETVPGEDDIKPDQEMLRDYTTTMSLALGESYSDSTADEEPQVDRSHEEPQVDRPHEEPQVDRPHEEPQVDRALPAVIVNKENDQASPEADQETKLECTGNKSDATLNTNNSTVNVPPANGDHLNTPHVAIIPGGRPLPIPRSLAPTPVPQPRKSLHSPTGPSGESTSVSTPTTPVNRESSGSEIFLSPLESLTQSPFVDQSCPPPKKPVVVKDEVTHKSSLSTNSSTKSHESRLSKNLSVESPLVTSKKPDAIIASNTQPLRPHRKLPELSKLKTSTKEVDQPAMCSSPKLIPKVLPSAADSKCPSHTQSKSSTPSKPTQAGRVPVISSSNEFAKPISPPIFRPPGKTKVPLDKSRLHLGSSSDHAESDHEAERKKKISADGIVIGGSVGDDIPFADESEAEEKFYTPCASEKTDRPKFPPVSGQPKKIIFNPHTPRSNPPVLSAEQIKEIRRSELEKAKQSKERPRIKSDELSAEVNSGEKKVSKNQKEIATFETLSISDVPSDSDNKLSSLQTATSSATEGDHVLQPDGQRKKKKKMKTPKNKKSKKDCKDKSTEPDKKEKRKSLLSLILPDKTPHRGSKDNLLSSDNTPKGSDDNSKGKSKTPKFKKNVDKKSRASQEDLDKTPTVDSKKELAICSVFHSEASNRQQSKGQLTVPSMKKTIPVAPKASYDELSDSDESHISLVTMQKRRGEDLDERLARRMKKIQLKQQKQAEQKRLRMAQEIQRQLEEVEVRQRELEERGITVEKALRGDGPDGEDVDEGQLMSEWFNLVHEKNALLRYESELNVRAKELELEDRQARLELDFRERSKKPAKVGHPDLMRKNSTKTEHDIIAEGSLLDELLNVVEQRNTLVAMLEEDRLSIMLTLYLFIIVVHLKAQIQCFSILYREQKEDSDLKQMMAKKGFVLSPMSY